MANTTQLLKVLSQGMITLGATENQDEYVLFVMDTKQKFAIPFIKNKTSAFAYIDSAIDTEKYVLLDNIIDGINKNKIYKSISAYKAINKTAPEHSHVITSIVSGNLDGTKSVQPKNLNEIITSLGYELQEATLSTHFIPKDYSELLKDPEVLADFKKDEAEIKKVDATFESLPQDLRTAYKGVMLGENNVMILTGPTGTGKSFGVKVMANKAKAPLLIHQLSGGTQVEDLTGEIQPKPGEKGYFEFVKGLLLKAYTEGYWVLLDEINLTEPQILAIVNQFGDGSNRVEINGTIYHKHPNFVLCLTMNPGYKGTLSLNMSLKGRCHIVDVPRLTTEELSHRAMAYSKGLGHQLSKDFFTALINFADFIEKEAKSNRWREEITFSLRNIQRTCDIILSEKCSFEEFFSTICIEYINCLSCDNDNSEKLQNFKKEKDVVEQVRRIYELYDFAEVKTVELSGTLDSIFTDDSEESSEDKTGDEDMVDDLLKRFEL